MSGNAFGDAADRYEGMTILEWTQLPDSEIPYLDPDGDDPTLPVWQPEPVEDASRYASEADYYDLTDLLETPTWPVWGDETRDQDGELLEEYAEPFTRKDVAA